jgi:hypothetical protein
MRLLVTLTGHAGEYLIRGAIWKRTGPSYRAYVHLVPAAPGRDLSRSISSVVSVGGPTWEGVLDTAIARVMTKTGTPVQNLRVDTTRARLNGRPLVIDSSPADEDPRPRTVDRTTARRQG